MFFMDKKEFIDWIKKEGLFHFIDEYAACFKRIIENNIDPVEEIIILSDHGYPTRRAAPIMAACYLEAAKQLGINNKLILQNPKLSGEIADEKIVEAFWPHKPRRSVT